MPDLDGTPVMTDDAQLLADILAEAPATHDGAERVTAKSLAAWCGLSPAAIYDYASGRRTVPMFVWRTLLRRFRDLRITSLLLDGLNYELILSDMIPALSNDKASFGEALAVQRSFHEQQQYLCDILADGRIDEADAERIRDFDRAYADARLRAACIRRAVHTAFASSTAARRTT